MSLLQLPAEMKEQIAENLEPGDLCSLRLVCRDVNEAILRPFASIAFLHLSFHLSEAELRGAIHAVEHVRYGKHVQVVRILVDEFPESERHPGYQTSQSIEFPFPSSGSDLQDQALLRQQSDMRRTKEDLHLLTVLFCKLHVLGAVSTIELAEAKQKSHDTAGMILASSKARRRPPLLDDGRPMLITLKALTSSGLRPSIFRTDCNDWAIPIHALERFSPDMYDFSTSFANVKNLQLHVWLSPGRSSSVQEFIPFHLGTLPYLEHLHLLVRTKAGESLKWTEQNMDKRAILSELVMVNFKKLRVLWLTGQVSSISYTSLVNLLSTNASLRSFRGQKLLFDGFEFNNFRNWNESMQDVLRRDTGIEDVVLEDCLW